MHHLQPPPPSHVPVLAADAFPGWCHFVVETGNIPERIKIEKIEKDEWLDVMG